MAIEHHCQIGVLDAFALQRCRLWAVRVVPKAEVIRFLGREHSTLFAFGYSIRSAI